VVPPPTGAAAPRALAVLAGPAPVDPLEQQPVAGEILSRPPPVKAVVKRNTELGLGPEAPPSRLTDRGADVHADRGAAGLAAKAGEVVVGVPKIEEARPNRKIILDPEIPEDDDALPGAARWVKPLGVVVGLALAVGVVWIAFKKTGHKHHDEAPTAVVANAAPAPTAVGSADAGAASAADAAAPAVAASASGGASARAGKHAVPAPVLDERMADPKVARALPTEFPQLLAACRQAFTEKRAKDAEIACLAAKDADPDSAEACALLGHALFDRKKRPEALQWAERAVELDPSLADAYVIIGGVKQAAADAPAAKAAYKKYLELAPNGQYANDLRAIVDSL
jgi:hypothetical protein